MRRGPLFPRRLRVGCVELHDPLACCAAFYLLLRFDGSGFLRIGLLAACLHECGHILVFWLCCRRMPVIEAGVTGLCMQTRGAVLRPAQRFALAAAGPAVNALLASVWYLRIERQATVWDVAFFAANVLTGLFNLLPIPPLDGAQLLSAAREWGREKRRSP